MITRNLPQQLVSSVLQLSLDPSVHAIILFGSRARGDNDAQSDVDLAVDAPGMSQRSWIRWRISFEEAPTLLFVSLVRLDRTPVPLRSRIIGEGICLYEQYEAT